MLYLSQIYVEQLRHLDGLEIDLTPVPGRSFSHLVLTGPNGSGKTTLLNALAQECAYNAHGDFFDRDGFKRRLAELRAMHPRLPQRDHPALESEIATISNMLRHRPVHLQWNEGDQKLINHAFVVGNSIFFHAPAQRQLGVSTVTGPQKFSISTHTLLPQHNHLQSPTTSLASYVLQLLVNKKTERTFASEEGETSIVNRIDIWLEGVRQAFGTLLEAPDIQMRFDRNAWNYTLVRPRDGRIFTLYELSHGHASALQLFSELLVRIEATQHAKSDPSFFPSGVVIIDEIETHLHLRLQETILPFLTHAFPTIQFIVATHSPAVIASIPNAIIFDLEKRETERSDELQGMRYGDLATGHFGIKSDYDIDTRHKLEELNRLFEKSQRTDEEESQMRSLAGELATKSHNLALDVLLRLKVAETHARESGGGTGQ